MSFGEMFMRPLLCLIGMVFLSSCSKPKGDLLTGQQRHWLQSEARRQLQGCTITAANGAKLFTPDGEGHYAALWTRDFAYMVENAYELLNPDDVKKAIAYLLQGQRSDGCIPDRRQADGLSVYSAGGVKNPLGDPPTDNSPFMIKLAADYVDFSGDLAFFRSHAVHLTAAMNYTPRSSDGLVYIDPAHPHSPYGFTDTIQKTGELLFSSLLYWEACQRLTALFIKIQDEANAAEFSNRAQQVVQHLDKLWDDETGLYRAASIDCRQSDIWGNAYAIYINFPLADKKGKIVRYLSEHFRHYVYCGQIRHLPEPEVWKKTLIPVKPGTYQNGAYWGTASGWVAYALAESHPQLARQIYQDLLQDYQLQGPHECVNIGYRQLNNYVASVVNPLGALRKF